MRFLIMVRATPAEDAVRPALRAFHDDLNRAGVLLDRNGLKPGRHGWRIRWADGMRQVIDGPSAGSHEAIAGYTLIQVRSRDEAMAWALRFPAPADDHATAEIEVRELCEPEEPAAPAP